jgi:site-specific DNA recombinase
MPARVLAMRRPAPQPDQNAVLYVRVSSKEQEQGFSIAAQLRLLRDYAQHHNLAVAREFVDIETAKRAGRTAFNAMLAFLHKRNTRTILVEKTDRLYRNLKDWVTIDGLELELHFVKENIILTGDSRSSEKFMHGIKVLMAKNYIDNLSEETRKGMLEKARAGLWPSYAPIGYKNTIGTDGKRVITTDPATAPAITQLFTWFVTGNYSLKTLAAKARHEGLQLHNQKVHKSIIHQILHKRLYTGDFDWDGKTYHGNHEPLVEKAVWERVQELLNKRQRPRQIRHDFEYAGILRCGHCGCNLVGEIKKKKYVYYHCTGNKGKCNEPYTRQERIHDEIKSVLRPLIIPTPIIDWLRETLTKNDNGQERARAQALLQAQQDYERLEQRLDAMYLDKLDGRITTAFHDEKATAWREEQATLQAKMNGLRQPTPGYDAAINAIQAISNLCNHYDQLTQTGRRTLLHTILEKATWQDGEFRATLKSAFAQLAHSNQGSNTKQTGNGHAGGQTKNWLLR